MNKSETIGELAASLAKAQANIKPAIMNAVNPFLKNRYADLGAVIDACRQPLAANGLSVVQPVVMTETSIGVETILMHTSGEWISSTITLPMGEERGKSAAQVAGSIITYLRRYSLAAMVGVYADEDTDGQKSEKKTEPEKAPAPIVFDANLPTMALVDAMNVTNKEGQLYGNLDTEKLAHMGNTLRKLVTDGKATEDHLLKLSAIQTILADRSK
jgi:hypothetical protein